MQTLACLLHPCSGAGLSQHRRMRNGDFNTPLTSVDKSSRQKINNEIMVINVTLDEINLIDIFGHFIQKLQNTHFSEVLHIEHFSG